MSQTNDSYFIVRESDNAIVYSLQMKIGDRFLMDRDTRGFNSRKLFQDERVISRATLTEIVHELASSIDGNNLNQA
ncbi:hypothetical protein TUM12370_17770 [Salmonella enterica subsp. enterica serovar Choleraesuis]|nr:hypothetical protein TUM12370_17770 [Salmonella enterica subsp. enterica serovar Choleraesuis]